MYRDAEQLRVDAALSGTKENLKKTSYNIFLRNFIYTIFSLKQLMKKMTLDEIRQNPYKVLNIASNSSIELVREEYKKLILKYHPDRVAKRLQNQALSEQEIVVLTKESEEKFKEIHFAYELICEIANTLVPNEATIKVFLPIYVVSQVNEDRVSSDYGITIKAIDIEDDASRFSVIMNKINQHLSHTSHQVGVDFKEAANIVNQHSWYKQRDIVLIGIAEINLPMAHLGLRAGESAHRNTPYFSIKQGTELKLKDISAFTPGGVPTHFKLNEKLTEIVGKGTLLNEEKAGVIRTIPLKKFNFNQTLNTASLIAEALDAYRKEYELAVSYSNSSLSILNDIKQLEAIHSSNSSIDEKLTQINTLAKQYGGRFAKISSDMIDYYTEINQLILPLAEEIVSDETRINQLALRTNQNSEMVEIQLEQIQRLKPNLSMNEIITSSNANPGILKLASYLAHSSFKHEKLHGSALSWQNGLDYNIKYIESVARNLLEHWLENTPLQQGSVSYFANKNFLEISKIYAENDKLISSNVLNLGPR